MIKMFNVEYDEISGIITATAEFEFVRYDIIVDTHTWEMISTDDNIPELIFHKCENSFKDILAKNEEFPSSYLIAWY